MSPVAVLLIVLTAIILAAAIGVIAGLIWLIAQIEDLFDAQ